MASEAWGAEVRREIIEWKERSARSRIRSATESEALVAYVAKKQRLLGLLAEQLRSGRIAAWEIAASLGKPLPSATVRKLQQVQSHTEDLHVELRFERAWNDFLDGEATLLEATLDRDRAVAKDSLYRIATLEQQLGEARDTTSTLVTATRDSLRSLQQVQDHLSDDGAGPYVLDPLYRDLYAVGRTVEQLHHVASPRDGTPPAPDENR